MKDINITNSVVYVGCDDKTLDLFESQYHIPNGVSYNSYVIFDEKITIMDTVDGRVSDEWFKKLDDVLGTKTPDYLVISHLEPDHAANIKKCADKYPNMKLVGNTKTFSMLPLYFDIEKLDERKVVVGEGEKLSLGKRTLTFFMAPMVHWPEVMVSYDDLDKILFSADAFGKFGALDCDEEWACEARRYYFNIVGKYGTQVQAALKKLSGVDISIICPLHGPILTENLGYYINLYDIWSSYRAEVDGIFIAYASIHGNTRNAIFKLKEILEEKTSLKIAIADVAREDLHECVEDAFKYSKMIIASPTYDGAIFSPMDDFLSHLSAKAYQNRKIAIVENGSWAPLAGKKIREAFENMKNITICENTVTLKGAMKDEYVSSLTALADEIINM